MKIKFYCPGCGVEAIIEIIDNPWGEEEELVQACFACGDEGVSAEPIDDDE